MDREAKSEGAGGEVTEAGAAVSGTPFRAGTALDSPPLFLDLASPDDVAQNCAAGVIHAERAGLGIAYGPWAPGAWDFATEQDADVRRAALGPVAAIPGEWLFVTAAGADRGAGRVLGFPLPLAGTVGEDDALLRVDGVGPHASAGTLGTGDVDGDGRADLLVGSAFERATLDDEGAVRAYALP